MGVRVPVIEHKGTGRTMLYRGYSIVGMSITIDEAASAFEAEVDIIIRLAETELRLERLTEAIWSTSRRLNALEQILIPRLKREIEYIKSTLDERERSDHFRLKLAKRLLSRKRV
jgi:V/A-type H+-transporting ATPase subunit D